MKYMSYINFNSNINELIEQIPYILFKKDPDSYYQYVNQHIINVGLVKKYDDILGKSDFEMSWRKDAEKYIEQDKLTLKGHTQFNLDILPMNDGNTFMHLCQKFPLYNEKRKI